MTTDLASIYSDFEQQQRIKKERERLELQQRLLARASQKKQFLTEDCKDALKKIDFLALKSALEENAAKGKKNATLFDIYRSSGIFSSRRSTLSHEELLIVLDEQSALENVKQGLLNIGLDLTTCSLDVDNASWHIPLGMDVQMYFNDRIRVSIQWE